ncbi:hypothetical protein WJ69_23110 [Burkholderia ubonensis]|uniref:hypothetical protein n=1 Tax=Burkholderia ubonensis TaxID=101571 RepID=UPI000752A6DE|nr:hypothetical protein [Burkholderia ubonensis]KVO05592.1 hypothetical protein WJ69_23110 [Burkholderia ubonensis]
MTLELFLVCIAWIFAAASMFRLNLRTAAGLRASIIPPICLCIAFLLALYAYTEASDAADDARTEQVARTVRGGA